MRVGESDRVSRERSLKKQSNKKGLAAGFAAKDFEGRREEAETRNRLSWAHERGTQSRVSKSMGGREVERYTGHFPCFGKD